MRTLKDFLGNGVVQIAGLAVIAAVVVVLLVVNLGDGAGSGGDDEQQVDDETQAVVPVPSDGPLEVTVVGDTIGDGYYASSPEFNFASLVEDQLSRRAGQIAFDNVSIPGAFPDQLVRRAPRQADLVIVAVGTDSGRGGDFSQSYPTLIDAIHDKTPDAQIVCVTPFLSEKDAAAANKTITKACDDPDVEAVADITGLFADAGNHAQKGDVVQPTEYRVPDDQYPNDAGHQAIADIVMDRIAIES